MKKLLSILFGLMLVAVVGVVILVNVIDPNQFKPLLVEQVKKQTGRDLVIDGDLSWRFWPSLGLSVDKLALKNPDGFGEPNLISIGHAEMSVAVLPLLSDHLDVGLISLSDTRLYVHTLSNGVSNLDGITDKSSTPTESTTESSDSQTSPDTEDTTSPSSESNSPDEATGWLVQINGVELVNASAVIRDDKAESITELSNISLSMGELKMDSWVPVSFDMKGKQNAQQFSAKGKTELNLNPQYVKSQLRQLELTASFSDAATRLDSASLTIDNLGFGLPATTQFKVKGEASGMIFDAKGNIIVTLDEAMSLLKANVVSLDASLEGEALPKKTLALSASADASYDLSKKRADFTALTLKADDIAVIGKASVTLNDIPAIRFAMNSDNIDLDKFLGLKETKTNKPPQQKKSPTTGEPSKIPEKPAKAPISDVEPDLTALKGLDLSGQIKIGQLKAANVKVSKVNLDVAVNRGLVSLKRFTASLYDGDVSATGVLDTRKKLARYSLKQNATGIQIQPLLMDAAQQDMLSGKGNVSVNLSGAGLSEKKLREGIKGTVGLNLTDGSVKGVNVAEMIREARAFLKGKKAEYVKEERKTDFSGLTATFQLGKGIASTDNVKLEAPLLRVRSEGKTSLVKETLDFLVFASVVETSKGQGGKDIDELKDVTIPVNIIGTWQAPDYKLDLKKLAKVNAGKKLEEKARKEAERGIKKLLGDKIGDDKTKDLADQLLKGLFN
ncbi:AsmA family protein [Veronia pacifica]|uniref:AsmA protein n=1 Tax=Veronia pacifica TaxID=1080227 RepID=A0A1C3EM32_9GAMM|nr:AsmA family protein [Veronia pacifica]ODA34284.1 AsmA protein [Veronia pacifica]